MSVEDNVSDSNLVEKELDNMISKKPRSATLLTLKWIAERVRKSTQVSEKVKSGNYKVDGTKLAEAILNKRDS